VYAAPQNTFDDAGNPVEARPVEVVRTAKVMQKMAEGVLVQTNQTGHVSPQQMRKAAEQARLSNAQRADMAGAMQMPSGEDPDQLDSRTAHETPFTFVTPPGMSDEDSEGLGTSESAGSEEADDLGEGEQSARRGRRGR
jgi:hypothetical protein